MSSPAVQGSKEPLRIVNNSVYEPQHVHTNGPTVHPPPVSLLSMTSNMGDSSFMASTAGDEYAFYRNWVRDQVDKDPELAAQWQQWEAQGLISPKGASTPSAAPWSQAASTAGTSTSTSAAAANTSHFSSAHPHHSHKKAEPDLREQIARHLAASHGSGGDGVHSAAAAAAVGQLSQPNSPRVAAGSPRAGLASAAGAVAGLFSKRSSQSGSPRSPGGKASLGKSPPRGGELSRTQLKAVRKLFPVLTPATKPAAALQGEYQLLDIIGKGAFGCAYKARHLPTGRLVCIKTMDVPQVGANQEEQLLRQKREVAVLATLALHPNIIRYHECFADGDKGQRSLQLVMEWADGGDLESVIQRHAKARTYMSEEQILGYFVQLISALSHVHAVGIMHRDIKANNVFMTSQGLIKLGDFGISKVIDVPTTTSNSGSGASKAAESNNTSSSGSMYPSKGVWAHSFVGTPNYLAPEMVACEGYGFKADVWAAGCVLYEMAALKPAFRAKHISIIYHLIRRGKTSPLPSIYSKELQALQRRMMAHDPAERPSCADLLQEQFLRPHFHRYHTLLRQLKLDLPRLPSCMCVSDSMTPHGSTSGAARTAVLLTSRGSTGGSISSTRTSIEDWSWNRAGSGRKKGSRESVDYKLPLSKASIQLGHRLSQEQPPPPPPPPPQQQQQQQQQGQWAAAAAMVASSSLFVSTGSAVSNRSTSPASRDMRRASIEAHNATPYPPPYATQNSAGPVLTNLRKCSRSSQEESCCSSSRVSCEIPAVVPVGAGPASKLLSRDASSLSSNSVGLNSFGSGVVADVSANGSSSADSSDDSASSNRAPSPDSTLKLKPLQAGAGAGAAAASAAAVAAAAVGAAAATSDAGALVSTLERTSTLTSGRPAALRIDAVLPAALPMGGSNPASKVILHCSAGSEVTLAKSSHISRIDTAAGTLARNSAITSSSTPAGTNRSSVDHRYALCCNKTQTLSPAANSALLQSKLYTMVQEQQQQQEEATVGHSKGSKLEKHHKHRHSKSVLRKFRKVWSGLLGGTKQHSRLGNSNLQSSAPVVLNSKVGKGARFQSRSSDDNSLSSGDGELRIPAGRPEEGQVEGYGRSWSDLLRAAGVSAADMGPDAVLLQQAGQMWEATRSAGNSANNSQRNSLEQRGRSGNGSKKKKRSLELRPIPIESEPSLRGVGVHKPQHRHSHSHSLGSVSEAAGGPSSSAVSPTTSPTGSKEGSPKASRGKGYPKLGGQGSVELPVPAAYKQCKVLSSWFGRPSRSSRASTDSRPSIGSRASVESPKSQAGGANVITGGAAAAGAVCAAGDAASATQQPPEQQQQGVPTEQLHTALAAPSQAMQLNQQLLQLTAAFGQGLGLNSSLSTITEGSESRMASRMDAGSPTLAGMHHLMQQLGNGGSSSRPLSPLGMASHWRSTAAGSDGADGDDDWQQHQQQVLPAVPEGPGDEQAVGGGADVAVDQDSQPGRDALVEREQLLAVIAVHKLKELLSQPVAPEQWFYCKL